MSTNLSGINIQNKKKLDGIATGANNYVHPITDGNHHVTDAEKALWNAKETPIGAQTKATTALTDAKAYADAGDATISSAIGQKASFKSGSFTFPSGMITHKITNTFITASTLVTIIPTTEKKGSWTVNSTNGSFTIISDTVEPIDVTCDWGAIK